MSRWITLFVLLLFALGWLGPDYAARMWRDGHYQFFPFVFVAVGWILWIRRAEITAHSTEPNRTLLFSGFVATVLTILFAQLMSSNWIGLFGLLIALATLVYSAVGWGGFRLAAPVLALLVFTIPLPLNYDRDLIIGMQFLASDLASRLLDGVGLIHFREGVVLVTERSQFMTEEACSGIRSLFASMAVVATWCVLMRHYWWRLAFNLVQTIGWVILGNAVRVSATVVLADHVSPWFASGMGHELLGLAVFAFILLMVFSTDAALELITLMQMNFLGRAGHLELEAFQKQWDDGEAWKAPAFPIQGRAWIALAGSLVVVGLLGFQVAWVRGAVTQATRMTSIPRLPAPDVDDLPEELEGFAFAGFEHVEREFDGLFAQDSYVWTYRRENLVALISIDCPWDHWHNLYYCYSGLGWTTEPNYHIRTEGETLKHSELQLGRARQMGFVLYSAVDRDGGEVGGDMRTASGRSLAALVERFANEVSSSLGIVRDKSSARMNPSKYPASTIQLYSEGGRYGEEERESLRKLYFEARRLLLENSKRWERKLLVASC